MVHQPLFGFIEVICGSMFSGKTEELMRRLRRAQIARQKVQVFKPIIDDRYSVDHIQSHDSNRIRSIAVRSASEILEKLDDNTRVVGIDEVQFFDESVVDVAQKLAYRGIRVISAGLDMDYRGEPFGPMPRLLAVAENVTKLSAVCMVCGGAASRTQKKEAAQEKTKPSRGKKQSASPILVGAQNLYEARCRFCHEPHGLAKAAVIPTGMKTRSTREKSEDTHGETSSTRSSV